MDHQLADSGALSESSASVNARRFVSAQRRYDNARVRDSEITKRLCYDCGDIVCGGEREYQEHILVHEAVYLAYQLYHFENNQQQQKDQPHSSTAAAQPQSTNSSATSQKTSPTRESSVQRQVPSVVSQPSSSDTQLLKEPTAAETVEKGKPTTDSARSGPELDANGITE